MFSIFTYNCIIIIYNIYNMTRMFGIGIIKILNIITFCVYWRMWYLKRSTFNHIKSTSKIIEIIRTLTYLINKLYRLYFLCQIYGFFLK